MTTNVSRDRANKALSRLRKRLNIEKKKHDLLHVRYLSLNDRLGNALFREQDPKSGYLAEDLRMRGLMWVDGKLKDNGIAKRT